MFQSLVGFKINWNLVEADGYSGGIDVSIPSRV